MGGMGSGASRFRRIAEEVKRIDIREFRRRGYFPHRRFAWMWTQGGEPSGSIGVETLPGEVVLRYTYGEGDDFQNVVERIALDVRPCRFGGHRRYFRCPRCFRRAEILYQVGRRFLCRKCGRVGYAIENLEKPWRADRRYRELEHQINEDGTKPSRMRWKTYERICDQLEQYDAASMIGLVKVLARLGITGGV